MILDTDSNVTLVITSCNRYDLLDITLQSILKHNTYPIKEYIVIEDGVMNSNLQQIMTKYPNITWIIAGERLGQLKCIDLAYSKIETEYIFHCEDDWEFYRDGFIEVSMDYLVNNPNIIQLWLRERYDTNGHPIEPGTNLLALNYENGNWNGFSFNPGLKRLSDYKKIGSYKTVVENYDQLTGVHGESNIGKQYRDIGYRAAIVEQGYVRHIGWNRRVAQQ